VSRCSSAAVASSQTRREPSARGPYFGQRAPLCITAEDLHDWLEARLSIDYPALVDPAQPDISTTSSIKALLGGGLVLPILDGLDEIPDTLRGPATARINDAVLPGEHLVVTRRTAPFREAVRPVGGVEVTLRGAAGIELRPLAPGPLADYLRAEAGGPTAATRWALGMAGQVGRYVARRGATGLGPERC
jgi:hypothetical protein